MDDMSFIAVVKHGETKLYHGAYYRDHPTPSGSPRPMLNKTTKGFECPMAAAKEINRAFPDMKPAEVGDYEPWVEPPEIPAGVEVTIVKPHDKSPQYVEVTKFDDATKMFDGIDLTARQVEVLVGRGVFVLDSSSGCDPELSAVYDHYRLASEIGDVA